MLSLGQALSVSRDLIAANLDVEFTEAVVSWDADVVLGLLDALYSVLGGEDMLVGAKVAALEQPS